jgi:hypothetical protein
MRGKIMQLSVDWLIFMAATAAVLSAFGIVLLDERKWCTGLAVGFAAAAVVIWGVTRGYSHVIAAFIALVVVIGVLVRFWPVLVPLLQRGWSTGFHSVLREKPGRSAEIDASADGANTEADTETVANLIVFVQHGKWMIEFNEKVFGPFESEAQAIERANYSAQIGISKGLSSQVLIRGGWAGRERLGEGSSPPVVREAARERAEHERGNGMPGTKPGGNLEVARNPLPNEAAFDFSAVEHLRNAPRTGNSSGH